MKNVLTGLVMLAVALTAMVASAPSAAADETVEFQVSFTWGKGVRLRTAPYEDAPGVGPYGTDAIPEGAWFSAVCEDYGDWITNQYGESTNIYMRSADGQWVSTAYLNTGTNSRVGLPLCSELDGSAPQASSGDPRPTADITTSRPHLNLHRQRAGTLAEFIYFKEYATVEGKCGAQESAGWTVASELCYHYIGASGTTWDLDMSRAISREEPLRAMYEWQLRNAVSSNLDAMKAVDAGSSKTFTWGTGWFGYKATDAFTDVYQALHRPEGRYLGRARGGRRPGRPDPLPVLRHRPLRL